MVYQTHQGGHVMGDLLIMNKQERLRKVVLEQYFAGFITRKDVCKRLNNISIRQLKRIISRYKRYGDKGLIHQSRGKRSTNAFPQEKKEKALALYKEKYLNFGPTFASEKLLEEDGLEVNTETLRLWLKAAGLWLPARKRKQHRKRRARRARFGELLQLDGSIHEWFEGSNKKQCLMNMVDDATGKTLAIMDTGETTRAAFALLKWWITEAGIPMAIYVDLKSLYISPKSLRVDENEELIEPEWLTHFSKACKKLGIEIIKAYSGQAKGRVERKHGVYQDRLVKELKLKKIITIEEANQFLSNGFINKLNEKFAKEPAEPQDAHIPLTPDNDLDQVLCWETTRKVKNDWTIQLNNQHYQIEKSEHYFALVKKKVTMRRHLDDSISLWYKENRLSFYPINEIPQQEIMPPKRGQSSSRCSQRARENKHKTPWSLFNPNWLKIKVS
jgi:transposase